MGIFKKLLHKDKKTAGHGDSGPADVLNPGGSVETEKPLPERLPKEQDLPGNESKIPESKPVAKGNSVMDILSPKRAPGPAPSPPLVEQKRTVAPQGLPGMLADAQGKIALAERRLADIEQVIPQPGAIFTEVKIAILESKIKLAELEIQFARLDTVPSDRSRIVGQVHKALFEAEKKIGEAEQKIQNITLPQPQVRVQLVELKIVLSEAKIACFLLKIALEKDYGGDIPAEVKNEVPPQTVAAPLPASVRPEPVPSPVKPVARPEPEVPSPAPVPRAPRVEAPMMKKPQFGQEGGKSPLEAGAAIDPLKFGVDLPDQPKDENIQREKVKIAAKPVDIVKDESSPVMGKEVTVTDQREEQRTEGMSTIDRMRILQSELPPGTAIIPKASVVEAEAGKIQIISRESDRTLVIEDFIRKGVDMRKQENYEDAILYFDRVLEMDPENEIAMNNKGVALRKLGKYQEAEACFDKVLAKNDTNASVWYNKSFVQFKLGRFEEALTSFDRTLDLDPGNATAWNGKGKVLQKLGRQAEADECFATAKELGFPS